MSTSNIQTNFLEFSLEVHALELLPNCRRLKSGRLSPYFFNSGLFTSGPALAVLADLYAAMIDDLVLRGVAIDVIFGPAYKGISLAAITAMACWNNHAIDVEYAFNRKEVKDHAEGGTIVGAECGGKKVLIIDDVTTTGTSIIEARVIVENAGGTVIGALVGFDREEQGNNTTLSAVQAIQQTQEFPVWSSVGLSNLIYLLETEPSLDPENVLHKIIAYREQYGA